MVHKEIKNELLRMLGISAVVLSIILTVSSGILTGNAIIEKVLSDNFKFLGIILFLGGIVLLAITRGEKESELETRVIETNKVIGSRDYNPPISDKLRTYLTRRGTYETFLHDYRTLCTDFRQAKIYVPGKEPKPEKYENLPQDKRRIIEELGKSYANALLQLMELGLRLNEKNTNYALIGGFGVLGHLYKHNPNFVTKWRGTDDIDILSDKPITTELMNLGFEKIPEERISMGGIPDKRLETYIKSNPYSDKPIKVQRRGTISFAGGERDESPKVYNEEEKIDMYGIPIRVASKKHLIASKTGIRTRKNKLGSLKDLHDIEHLKSVQKLAEIASKRGQS